MVKAWDRGADYELMYRKLLRLARSETERKASRRNAAILLVQLRNGSRISEAIRAFKEFVRTGKREIEVKISKKKREELRLMIIPEELAEFRLEFEDVLDIPDEKLNRSLRVWSRDRLRVNTHSLRYAYITFLLKQGVNPSIVAKIVGHSKLDFVLRYTQQKTAIDVLKNMW